MTDLNERAEGIRGLRKSKTEEPQDLIERNAAVKHFLRWREDLVETYGTNDEYVCCLDRVIETLEELPKAKVKYVRPEAEWIPLRHNMGFLTHPLSEDFKCSNCGYEYNRSRYKYYNLMSPLPKICPECGAKMKGEADALGKPD